MVMLADKIKRAPQTPGVYFLKDAQGKILYVGKARNLRNRVRSHFHPYSGFSGTRANLSNEIADIDWQETDSEIEALLLESRLIKKLKPRYNTLMRDDKQYFFVGFTREDFPRIFITHQPRTRAKHGAGQSQNATYLGPFTDGGAIKKTVRMLRSIFPYYTLRHSSGQAVKKHPKRKCIYCHIGLCPGPNPKKTHYQKNIQNIKNILKGKQTALLKKLGQEMKRASRDEVFEKAAELRDKIEALENVFGHAVVLSPDAIEKISQPAAADKGSSLDLIRKELEIKLGIRLSPDKPIRIEGYDISNIQGTYATGSMVVFDNTAVLSKTAETRRLNAEKRRSSLSPNRGEYRKFRIKTVGGANDVAMMKEVLRRRFKHSEWQKPDLILVDGGRAQLNAALIVTEGELSPLGGTVPRVIALAKREEEIYTANKSKPVKLSKNDPLRLLLMHIRDEAHRFAIGYYRKLHEKAYR